MEIPLNAHVECSDGICAHSVFVLINPVIDKVTHLVVKQDAFPNTEYIVPVELVVGTMADTIQLNCSKAELEKMDPFIKTTFISERVPENNYGDQGGMYGIGSAYYLPYVIPEKTVYEFVDYQQIPPGELAVKRGTRIEATDGEVGKIDEFVVNPKNGHITHMVMREGHLWGKKEVVIPLSAMAVMNDRHQDVMYLNINKHQVEALPTFPVHRKW